MLCGFIFSGSITAQTEALAACRACLRYCFTEHAESKIALSMINPHFPFVHCYCTSHRFIHHAFKNRFNAGICLMTKKSESHTITKDSPTKGKRIPTPRLYTSQFALHFFRNFRAPMFLAGFRFHHSKAPLMAIPAIPIQNNKGP